MYQNTVRKLNDALKLAPPIKVTTQMGSVFKIDFVRGVKAFLYKPNGKYFIVVDWLILGEYETVEQVKDVLDTLKTAIERGDKEFSFTDTL